MFAIRTEGLGKRYRLGQRAQYVTLRDTISSTLTYPVRAVRTLSRTLPGAMPPEGARAGAGDEVWALSDVTLNLDRGEAVGVIGRNGAGKSTLLKILTRITAPSAGFAEVRGRIGSLLEVGTGFHPELTGRENIYLSGTILGMRRSELDRRFHSIVEFAEVAKFIDTPVKRYSSGMYVRLAFAVAAHLEPDILMVDEVLSVGDAAFQKKCLARMEQVSQETGQTVLFVSHSMAAIASLTQRTLWLDGGRVRMLGPTAQVIERYLAESLTSFGDESRAGVLDDLVPGPRSEKWAREVVFRSVAIRDPRGATTDVVFEGQPISIDITFESTVRRRLGEIVCFVHTLDGVRVTGSVQNGRDVMLEEGIYRTRVTFDPGILRPGRYRLDLILATVHQFQDSIEDRLHVQVEPRLEGYDEPRYRDGHMGLVLAPSRWEPIVRGH